MLVEIFAGANIAPADIENVTCWSSLARRPSLGSRGGSQVHDANCLASWVSCIKLEANSDEDMALAWDLSLCFERRRLDVQRVLPLDLCETFASWR